MEKISDETKPGLETAVVLARSDVVRTKQSQNFTNSKGLNEEDDDSQSLPEIHDAEVFKYLNNEKEARYKRIIWEIMNRDYLQGNNQKRVKKDKKADSTKKLAKPPTRGVKNEKRLSSKINYDILNKLNHDDGVDKIDNIEDVDSLRIELQPENELSNYGVHSSGDGIDNESAHENEASEEGDDIQDGYGMSDPEMDDEYAGYDEEYDYEQY